MSDEKLRACIARVLFEQANEVPPGRDASAIMAQWREQGGLTASFVREFERRADAIITALRADPDAMAGLAGDGMRSLMADVEAFHRACDVPVLASPRIVPERVELRRDILREEAEETDTALADGDLVALADGLADTIYVAIGTALEFGIPLDAVWAEVQRSNMAKRDPATGSVRRREDGKVLKPANWVPPNIAGIIASALPSPPHGDT